MHGGPCGTRPVPLMTAYGHRRDTAIAVSSHCCASSLCRRRRCREASCRGRVVGRLLPVDWMPERVGGSADQGIVGLLSSADDGVVSGKVVGRFLVFVVIDPDDRDRTPAPSERTRSGGDRSMIELTVTLTDQQLAEIAERAAALVPTSTQTGSPWLNVTEAAERLRCSKGRIYDLIALGKLNPRRDGRRVLLRRDDLDAYLEGRTR